MCAASAPRIALFHATTVAMAPVRSAMAAHWPEAEGFDLLDESLSLDRAKSAALTPELTARFVALGQQAVAAGAKGILVTCSAFGPAITALQHALEIPVLMPNEAMFRQALGHGNRIGMVATFAPAIPTMEEEFTTFAQEAGSAARLETVLAPGAIDSLRRGDTGDHDIRVSDAARALAGHDAVMLAQFSTARAAAMVRAALAIPVLTAPEAAVLRLRALLQGDI